MHYDIHTQKRLVSVDDGTLQKLPSKLESKKKLADAIDLNKYLSLNQQGRYDYVMDTIESEFKQEKKQDGFTGRVRKFNLVDLTRI